MHASQAIIGVIVMIHWFSCFWALLPQLQPQWRDEPGLEPAVAACVADPSACVWAGWQNGTCTGCVAASASTEEICSSTCLTPCEREVMAVLSGESAVYVRARESWLCRAAEDGFLKKGYADAPFDVWLTAALVAMFQLVGGAAGIVPSNPLEYASFILAILTGTLVFAAIQGVIVQVGARARPTPRAPAPPALHARRPTRPLTPAPPCRPARPPALLPPLSALTTPSRPYAPTAAWPSR